MDVRRGLLSLPGIQCVKMSINSTENIERNEDLLLKLQELDVGCSSRVGDPRFTSLTTRSIVLVLGNLKEDATLIARFILLNAIRLW